MRSARGEGGFGRIEQVGRFGWVWWIGRFGRVLGESERTHIWRKFLRHENLWVQFGELVEQVQNFMRQEQVLAHVPNSMVPRDLALSIRLGWTRDSLSSRVPLFPSVALNVRANRKAGVGVML